MCGIPRTAAASRPAPFINQHHIRGGFHGERKRVNFSLVQLLVLRQQRDDSHRGDDFNETGKFESEEAGVSPGEALEFKSDRWRIEHGAEEIGQQVLLPQATEVQHHGSVRDDDHRGKISRRLAISSSSISSVKLGIRRRMSS